MRSWNNWGQLKQKRTADVHQQKRSFWLTWASDPRFGNYIPENHFEGFAIDAKESSKDHIFFLEQIEQKFPCSLFSVVVNWWIFSSEARKIINELISQMVGLLMHCSLLVFQSRNFCLVQCYRNKWVQKGIESNASLLLVSSWPGILCCLINFETKVTN